MLTRALGIAGALVALVCAERWRPLRARTHPTLPRTAKNALFAATSALAIGPVGALITGAALRVERRRHGLLQALPLPAWARRIAGVVLLDYALWHWHRANHVVPALWRSHRRHHADPDLDVSTAIRFHAGELLAAVPVTALQVLVLGIDRPTLRLWQTLLAVEVAFHHANLALPTWLDAALSRVIITPRLHGIHHAAHPNHLDTNFGTVLAWWDVLHGTRCTGVSQDVIRVGLRDDPR